MFFPFLSLAWQRLWWKVFGENFEELFLVVDDIIIALIARQGTTIMFSGGKETADYLDLLGPDDKKARAWNQILSYCKENGITQLALFNVPQSSSTISYFQNLHDTSITVSMQKGDTTPIIVLQKTWDEYLSSLPHHDRHELKRKMKNFETQHPDTLYSISKNPSSDIKALLALMHRDEKKHLFLTSQMESFFKKLPKAFQNNLILFFLRSDNKIAAALLAFKSGQALLTYNSGFNETEFSGAGLYLKAKTIQWAIENRYKEYNLLQGSEPYKYDLGGKDFFVYTIEVSINP